MRANIIIQPSARPELQDEDEYRYFKIFRDRTASELSGYFESNVWDRLILQVCHEEPFARHAVVAIGALNKTLEIHHENSTYAGQTRATMSSAQYHHAFALQQYGKSLQLIRQSCQEDEETLLRNTLISSLLTTCFESYIGNQENALTQAQAGVDVLAEYNARDQSNRRCSGAVPFLDEDLICTFARLDSLLLMFNNPQNRRGSLLRYGSTESRFPQPSLLLLSENIPSAFGSLREARWFWDVIVRAAMWLRVASHPNEFSTLDFGESDVHYSQRKADAFGQKIQRQLQLYTSTIEKWFGAFKPVFDGSRTQDRSKDFRGASILMIKYLSSRIAIPQHEALSDEFLSDYISIFNLARELLEMDDRSRSPGRPLFIFDDSLVAGLFLVATRCRNRKVRRDVIELLRRHPRREGLWDSLMAAKVATWFMNAEEEGLVGDIIPAHARMKIVKNDFVLSERKAVVRCSKIAVGREDPTLLPEVTLTW